MDLSISSSELLKSGMKCLTDNLGIINAERFISLIIKEQFDYTKWQKTYFDSIEPKQFDEALLKYSEENPHTGNAKKII